MISLKVSFNQAFLKYSGNLVTSSKLLGSGMKCDTCESDYTKLGYAFFSSFEISLNTLCKPLPVLFSKRSYPFHSFFGIIRSRILNIAYLALVSGCIWLPSQMSSRAFVLIDPPSESLSVDNSSIEAKFGSYSSALCFFSNQLPSSNCAKVIMPSVCSWYDAAYGIYDTSCHIARASEYRRDVYANALEIGGPVAMLN